MFVPLFCCDFFNIVYYIFPSLQIAALAQDIVNQQLRNVSALKVMTNCGHYRVVRDAADSVTAYQTLGRTDTGRCCIFFGCPRFFEMQFLW